MKKMVVLDGRQVSQDDLGWELLEEFGDLVVYDSTPDEKVLERIGDAEYIFVNKVPITRHVLEHSQLKYIGLFSTGYNVIDVEAARDCDVVVSNVPDYSTHAVAQFTFALLLHLCHKVSEHNQAVQQGEWIRSDDFCFLQHPQHELLGKRFGIIGFGNIGSRVANIAASFGMEVLVHTRSEKEGYPYRFVSFETLLSESDIVSIHCPLNDATREMIDAHALSLMKDGALLINTARGAILNELALAESLKSGKLRAAALDVVSVEPMSPNCPLVGIENCTITPHIAWLARETRERLLAIVANNLRCFLQGSPQNQVS